MSFGPAARAVLLAAGLVAAASVAEARTVRGPGVEGFWDSPGGRLEITRLGDTVTGTLVSPIAGSSLDAGLVVLKGTFFEDNVTGDVRLGLVASPCGAIDKTAFTMLLLTKSGKLTGSVATKEKCATGVQSVLFTRSAEQTAKAKPDAAPKPPDFGLYEDTSGKPAKPTTAISRMLQDGLELAQAGQYELARRRFLKATEEAPNRGEAWNGVGVTYAMRNDYEQAIDWYKRGLENAPGFADLYFNMACAYAQLGKKPMALRYLRLSAVKGYGQPEMLDDPDLEPLRAEPEFAQIKSLMSAPPAPPHP